LFGAQPTAPSAGGGLFSSTLPGTSTLSPGSIFGGPSASTGPTKIYSINELRTNTEDIPVQDSPKDTVSSLVWSPNNLAMFATSSWDGGIRVYETTASGVIVKVQQNAPKPILSTTWSQEGTQLFFGGADNKCYLWNLQTNQLIPAGTHNDIVQRVFSMPGQPIFGSVSADKTVRYWDLRAGTTPTSAAITVQLGYNPSGFDARGSMLAISDFGTPTTVYGFDLRNPQTPAVKQASQLKYATCCLSIFADLSGFAIAGIEGRCSLQYWNEDPSLPDSAKRGFTFRCHRVDQANAYSVHDIHHYPKNPEVFSTCGGDGTVCFWDKKFKHRLRQFTKIPLPVNQGKFNYDGSLFAYAVGYDWAQGADAAASKGGVGIFVHSVTQAETVFSGEKKNNQRR